MAVDVLVVGCKGKAEEVKFDGDSKDGKSDVNELCGIKILFKRPDVDVPVLLPISKDLVQASRLSSFNSTGAVLDDEDCDLGTGSFPRSPASPALVVELAIGRFGLGGF